MAIGIREIAVNRLLQMAPDLRIGGQPEDASPPEVWKLIDLLLDDARVARGQKQAFEGERMFEVAMAGDLARKGRYVLRPVMDHNARTMIDYTSGVIQAGSAPSWPAARAMLPPPLKRPSYLNMLANILVPAFDRAVEQHYRVLTDQHLAATTLALRWYAVDHNGQRPQKLAELVPTYSASVPTDTHAAGGQPVSYLAQEPDPLIYSVGVNGVDDHGSEAALLNAHRYLGQLDPWSMQDRVVHLNRQPRPPRTEE